VDEKPVLICYDGSAGADRAIATAAGLLGRRRAVVVDIGPVITEAESLAALSPVLPGEAFEELNAAEAGQVAEQGAARARSAGLHAEAHPAVAAPTWQGIVDVADELDAAVIVIGSRGLTGLREVFDSVSRQVVEHAGRPVLIVPPPHDRH
jgi:nucleotide-binding universal stress UspA family protein